MRDTSTAMRLARAYATARVQEELAGARDATLFTLRRLNERTVAAYHALEAEIGDLAREQCSRCGGPESPTCCAEMLARRGE